MRSGDYCRADSGTIHGETFSDSGCLFLLSASPQNEVFCLSRISGLLSNLLSLLRAQASFGPAMRLSPAKSSGSTIHEWLLYVIRKEEITDLSRTASNVVSPDAMLVSAIRSGDEQ